LPFHPAFILIESSLFVSPYCLFGGKYGIIPRMTRTYELMLIVKADFPVDDTAKRDALITKLTKGAKIIDLTNLGKKTFAYPIKKQKEGVYLLVHLESAPLHQSDIENEAKLGTDVVRFLLIER